MVKIIDYRVMQNSEGEEFFGLILQGGIELVKSSETGRYYATAKSCTITSTFEEEMCKSLVGKDLPGRISKVQCEPFEYVLPETGELITMEYRWEYVPEDESMESQVFEKEEINHFV